MELMLIALGEATFIFVIYRYCRRVKLNQIRPFISTWILFGMATTGTLSTYILNGEISPVGLSTKIVDMFLIGAGIRVIAKQDDRLRRKLTPFEYSCFGFWFVFLAAWLLSGRHFASSIFFELLMAYAYLPMWWDLYKTKKNEDSYEMWFGVLVAVLFFLVPALRRGDILALFYLARNVFTSGLTIALMYRADRAQRSS